MIFEFFCVKTSYKTVSLSFQCFWPCFVTKLWPMPAVVGLVAYFCNLVQRRRHTSLPQPRPRSCLARRYLSKMVLDWFTCLFFQLYISVCTILLFFSHVVTELEFVKTICPIPGCVKFVI